MGYIFTSRYGYLSQLYAGFSYVMVNQQNLMDFVTALQGCLRFLVDFHCGFELLFPACKKCCGCFSAA